MTYSRENLQDLSRRLESELPIESSSTHLRRNLYTPFSRTLAAAVYGLHDHLDWRTKQMFPQTCDDDVLENIHADLWLQGDTRNPAVAAQGTAVVRGLKLSTIPAGTSFNRNDGMIFTVMHGVTISESGSATVRLIAQTPGKDGNTNVGSSLYLANPISGVEKTAVVVAISGGAELETLDELRQRIIDSRKQGGAVGRTSDWVRWAKEVSGVTRAWAAPKLSGVGTVTVYFLRDNDDVIYPDAAEQKKVETYLRQTGLPFGEIYAVSPIPKLLNFRIHLEVDTLEIRQEIEASIKDALTFNASPVAYDANGDLDLPPHGNIVYLSNLNKAIGNVSGEYSYTLYEPNADIQLKVGEIPDLGGIVWIP